MEPENSASAPSSSRASYSRIEERKIETNRKKGKKTLKIENHNKLVNNRFVQANQK